uniref:(northern house mosquito) hypothetical protein n=1 Tax=Culex pipiens TaxID=7175 RepID=A0A8D8MEH8_CULPI
MFCLEALSRTASIRRPSRHFFIRPKLSSGLAGVSSIIITRVSFKDGTRTQQHKNGQPQNGTLSSPDHDADAVAAYQSQDGNFQCVFATSSACNPAQSRSSEVGQYKCFIPATLSSPSSVPRAQFRAATIGSNVGRTPLGTSAKVRGQQ